MKVHAVAVNGGRPIALLAVGIWDEEAWLELEKGREGGRG